MQSGEHAVPTGHSFSRSNSVLVRGVGRLGHLAQDPGTLVNSVEKEVAAVLQLELRAILPSEPPVDWSLFPDHSVMVSRGDIVEKEKGLVRRLLKLKVVSISEDFSEYGSRGPHPHSV